MESLTESILIQTAYDCIKQVSGSIAPAFVILPSIFLHQHVRECVGVCVDRREIAERQAGARHHATAAEGGGSVW